MPGIDEPIEPEQTLDLEIPHPARTEQGEDITPHGWLLVAQNKKVIKGWNDLCLQIPENAKRCYLWLRNDPTRRIPGRCYELKYKHYAGAWAFEVGSGQRVYYKIREGTREVLIYYAGPHPAKAPYPPT